MPSTSPTTSGPSPSPSTTLHALAGDVGRAREVFDLAVSVRNDVDLLAEEYGDGELLGNLPQAFSHVGLVTAAWAIDQAERGGPEDLTSPAVAGA